MLGASSELNLTYGQFYYIDMSINGQDINWTSPSSGQTINRIQFQSQNGQISSGMIQVNAVNATIIQNDAITSAKIAPSAVNSSHLNSTGMYYMGRLGIGTTAPSSTLEVKSSSAIGALNITNGTGYPVFFVNASSGNVGIGTTNSDFGGAAVKIGIVQADGSTGLAIGNTTGAGRFALNPESDGSWSMYDFGGGTWTRGIFQKSGNVGIGTTSPGQKLSIVQDAASSIHSMASFFNPSQGNTQYNFISVGKSLAAAESGLFGFTLEAGNAGRAYIGVIGDDVAGGVGLIVKKGGNVGIGTTSPSYQLQLSTDSAAKPSTNTWTIASDARIKTDIRPFNDSLSVIDKINPVWYKYNGLGGFAADGKDQIGVIGQDIQKAAPYTVNTYKAKLNPGDANETELLNFNSHALTFVLINSVKELKAENDALKQLVCLDHPDAGVCRTG